MTIIDRLTGAARMALALVSVYAVLTGLMVGQAQSAPIAPYRTAETPAAAANRAIGTWSANVTTTIPSSGTVTYVFRSNGTMTVTAGTASVTGSWQADDRDNFTFVIDNALTDANGNTVGERHAEQDATLQDEKHFTSTGTTVDTDLTGNVVRTFQVDISATRIDS